MPGPGHEASKQDGMAVAVIGEAKRGLGILQADPTVRAAIF
jgi:hypothetical protein